MTITPSALEHALLEQKILMQQMIQQNPLRTIVSSSTGLGGYPSATPNYAGMDFQGAVQMAFDRIAALEDENKKLKQQFDDLKEYIMMVKA